MFLGYVPLESTAIFGVLFAVNGSPLNSDSLPTFRVYGPVGLMTGGAGTATLKDHGAITNATNAGPISITSVSHGLTSGTTVVVSGVLGNTGANGTFLINVVDADTFTLTGSTGTGAYTSGGMWNVAGLYNVSIACTSADGYAPGDSFSLLVNGSWSGTPASTLYTFVVT